jgi:starch synthase (maltosyl-transferring)
MTELPDDGRRRVVIENVTPRVEDGRFPVKRVVGDELTVEADAFADGHDEIRVVLRWTGPLTSDGSEPEWHEFEMAPLGNDRWRASFALPEIGRYRYTVSGWVDRFRTWQHDLRKRVDAGQDVTVDLQIGAALVAAAADRASGSDAEHLRRAAEHLNAARALNAHLLEVVERSPDRSHETTSERPYEVVVDPERARFSAWYELFPRSASPDPKRHGTLRDVIARLPYIAGLGFDVLYLPPIHPIGRQFRKGPNNVTTPAPDDPGVPWAIGGPDGGHTTIHPELGTFDDFAALVEAARAKGIAIALDIAFQASPDHPWVREHPSWFRARPDGTIQYAENPPKKYQDIYPFDFESEDWPQLWQALHDVFVFWIERGVAVFRVDNPHTKTFAFWEWCIGRIKAHHPQVLFLSEAFTRPKLMYRLAKLGFSQSYTYFTWRNAKQELADYATEVTRPPVSEFFRPNFWTNTPDILHAYLQTGGRPAFIARAVLASTLTASWGMYGPPYELLERRPREPGSEEYLDSEKYEQRTWDLKGAASIAPLIGRLNAARRAHAALQSNERLSFHAIDNDSLIAYSKSTADGSDIVLAVVNLDPAGVQAGSLELDLERLGLPADGPYAAHDLLDDTTYRWQGRRAWIELDPAVRSAHLFHLRPQAQAGRTKHQLEGVR